MAFTAYTSYLPAGSMMPWEYAAEVMLAIRERRAVFDLTSWAGYALDSADSVYQALHDGNGFSTAPHMLINWRSYGAPDAPDIPTSSKDKLTVWARRGTLLFDEFGWSSAYLDELYPSVGITVFPPGWLATADYWNGLRYILTQMKTAALVPTTPPALGYSGVGVDAAFHTFVPTEEESCPSTFAGNNVRPEAMSAYTSASPVSIEYQSGFNCEIAAAEYPGSLGAGGPILSAIARVDGRFAVTIPSWFTGRSVSWRSKWNFGAGYAGIVDEAVYPLSGAVGLAVGCGWGYPFFDIPSSLNRDYRFLRWIPLKFYQAGSATPLLTVPPQSGPAELDLVFSGLGIGEVVIEGRFEPDLADLTGLDDEITNSNQLYYADDRLFLADISAELSYTQPAS